MYLNIIKRKVGKRVKGNEEGCDCRGIWKKVVKQALIC